MSVKSCTDKIGYPYNNTFANFILAWISIYILQFHYHTGTVYGILIAKFQIGFEFGEGIEFKNDLKLINSPVFMNQVFTKVYVEGEVKSPGVYDFYPGWPPLLPASWPVALTSTQPPNRARVIRSSESGEQQPFKMDLEKIQRGDAPDFPLQPGDRIFIPESWL